jgi:hypothetical protein
MTPVENVVVHNASTGVDSLASIVIIIVVAISLLVLLGMGAMMAIGAVFSNRPLVTSWPTEQEHAFAVFERRGSASNSQAWVFSIIGAAIVTFVATGIYFAIPPERKDMTKGMNMSNLTKKKDVAAPAPAVKPAAPAEAPAADPAKAPEAPKP